MKRVKGFLSALLGGVLLLAAAAVQAAVVQPCLSNAASGAGGPAGSAITMLPIVGGGQTYCQTAFGWSDTWFHPSPPGNTYNQHLDVLSGDNAPSAYFFINGVPGGPFSANNTPTNYGLIAPWLDGGNLDAHFIGSDWQVVNDINVPGGGPVGTSRICIDPFGGDCAATGNGLFADITTTVGANGVTEQFTFTNNLSNVLCAPPTDGPLGIAADPCNLSNLFFDDYFNFHANGSGPTIANPLDTDCPTTQYAGGIVTTTGSSTPVNGHPCSPVVLQGIMFGTQGGNLVNPFAVSVGTPAQVLADMAALDWVIHSNPCQGDCSADLLWQLGALGFGDTATLTVDKITIPEPASLGLMGLGLVVLQLFRRRAR